jgi:hypothetical protein
MFNSIRMLVIGLTLSLALSACGNCQVAGNNNVQAGFCGMNLGF